jgi:hypothetical protein
MVSKKMAVPHSSAGPHQKPQPAHTTNGEQDTESFIVIRLPMRIANQRQRWRQVRSQPQDPKLSVEMMGIAATMMMLVLQVCPASS